MNALNRPLLLQLGDPPPPPIFDWLQLLMGEPDRTGQLALLQAQADWVTLVGISPLLETAVRMNPPVEDRR